MRLLLSIIKRFLLSTKSNKEIGKLSFFSYLLVGLGVAVPILVLSVTNGFQSGVQEKITDYEFHYQLSFSSLTKEESLKAPKGASFFHFYEDKCLIKSNRNSQVTQLRAFSKEGYYKYKFFKNYKLVAGRLTPLEGGIVLAENLASTLRVGLGEEITILALDHSIGYNQFTRKNFVVQGIISLGYAAYDVSSSFILKKDANSLFMLSEDAVNKVGVYLDKKQMNKSKAWELKLKKAYPKAFVSNTLGKKIFKDFQEEKKSLTASMLVIILIAFIAIFITLNVILADKTIDLALLRVIGFNKNQLIQMFMGQGFFIAFIGTSAGFFTGCFLILNLSNIISLFELLVNNIIYLVNVFGVHFPYRYELMPKDVFYQTSLPYKLVLKDFIIQGIGTFVLALFASLSPALKVIRSNPAEIFRNE